MPACLLFAEANISTLRCPQPLQVATAAREALVAPQLHLPLPSGIQPRPQPYYPAAMKRLTSCDSSRALECSEPLRAIF